CPPSPRALAVDLQPALLSRCIASAGDPARHQHTFPVASRLRQLTFPLPLPGDFFLNFLQCCRVLRLRERIRRFAQDFAPCPSVEALRTSVPENQAPFRIENEDGLARQLQQ